MLVSQTRRIAWIDNVKAFAILCVIIGHAIGLLEASAPGMADFGALIVAFNMPLFVIMAGWTAWNGLNRIIDWESFLFFCEKLIERTVLPSVAFSAIYAIVQGELFARRLWLVYFLLSVFYYLLKCEKERLPEWLRKPIRTIIDIVLIVLSFPINYFWFLAMIIEFQALWGVFCFALHWIGTEWKLVMAILGYAIIVWGKSGGWFQEFVIYYSLGIVLRYFDCFAKCLKMPWWSYVLILAAIAVGFHSTRFYSFYEFSPKGMLMEGNGWIFVLRQLTGVLLSFVVIQWIRKLSGQYGSWSRFGSFSMALYMVHTQMLAICPMSFSGSASWTGWLWLLLIVVVWTAVSYGVILALNWWHLTRKIFLGKD